MNYSVLQPTIEAIELAKTLIQFPSITPNDQGCQDFIASFLKKLQFKVESLPFADVSNLWARIGTQDPLFVFAGHTDVVPPGPISQWISPPFSADIRDDYLYGRGATDMKGAIAAMLFASQQFLNQNKKFKGSIGFLITSDEEGPAISGTKKVIEVLKERHETIHYCIVGEPSSDQRIGDQLRIGRRGSLNGRAKIQGKQGHVAHPHLAKNPIHESNLAFSQLIEKKWDQGTEDFPPTTFQLTNILSGTGALNVIPGELEVAFNFRFSPAVTVFDLQSTTEQIFKQNGLDFSIDWECGAHPFLSKKGKLLTIVENAIKTICQYDTKCSTGGGTSDARYIAPTGAEVVELGLIHTTAHHINECIKVSDLISLTQIYQRILEKIF